MSQRTNLPNGVMGSSTARYFVAKYIPDAQRLEPRNIGVIVWSPQGLAASFMAEKDQSGDVDGRALPAWVRSVATYKQWITYWRGIVTMARVDNQEGETIDVSDPAFIPALLATSPGSYCLVDGGFLLDRVRVGEIPLLTASLYRKLVVGGDVEVRPTLESELEAIIAKVQLRNNPNFHRRYIVRCAPPEGPAQDFPFSYAFKNGVLQQLYERVPLHPTQRQRNVDAAAWKFQKVVESNVVAQEQTAALIYASEKQLSESGVEEAIAVLGSVTRVVNVADSARATREFARLPALANH